MKTLHWFGFFFGRLARILELMGRGSIPVDGCNVADQERARMRRPQPVRWGNFR